MVVGSGSCCVTSALPRSGRMCLEWRGSSLKVLDPLYVTCGGSCRKYWLFAIKGYKCPPCERVGCLFRLDLANRSNKTILE